MEIKDKIDKFYLKIRGGIIAISGGSMEPIIKSGWKVQASPVTADEIRIGDVVIFECVSDRDILVCHRIAGKMRFFNKMYFLHKGDNCSYGGIMEARHLVSKVIKVFDDKGLEVTSDKWMFFYFKDTNFFKYVYLFLHLIKIYILRMRINKTSDSVNRFFWKFLAKDTKRPIKAIFSIYK